MPTYLRFVFSLERRVNNFAKIDKTLKLLMSRTTASVEDLEYWNLESQSLIEKFEFDKTIVAAANKKYSNLCKLIAETSQQENKKTIDEILNPEASLKNWPDDNEGVKLLISMMTVLYGPIESKTFQYI